MARKGYGWLVAAGLCVAAGYAIAALMRRAACLPKPAYRGNEGNLIVHHRSCRYFDSPSATRPFASREEAVQAGYQPCKLCCA
jgi:hypothetical protein